MKRISFLRNGLSIAVLISAPLYGIARVLGINREKTGFKVDPGMDRNNKSISLFEGDTFYTKVSTADTDGDLYAYESNRVKEGGPALHYHFDQDEWWYVIKGEFQIKVGETTYDLKEGGSAFGPRMVPHAFSKVGSGEGKLLIIFQPAGKMEVFFEKISAGVARTMSETEQEALREAHGFKRVGPALKYFKKP